MVKRNYLTELVLLGLVLISNREALAQDCVARPDPANGHINLLDGDGVAEGSVIQFECDTGYTVSGTAIINCAGGVWSDSDPTCPIDDCGSITGFTGGTIDYTSGTTYLSMASFTCDNGYTMTTTSSRTCEVGGIWSNANAVCDPVDCGALTITEGTPVYTTGTTFGSVASFNCNPGYYPSVVVTRTCEAGGTWSNANPVCDPIDCGALGNPFGGTADSSAGTTYGSVATFTCDLGYTMTGTATSTCQADESWDNLDPGCQINDCGVLGNPPGGTVDISAGTTYGSVATFTCDLDYTMTGTATSTCQADSTWDNVDPGCQINVVDCGVVEAVANGSPTYTSGTTYGSTASFTCDTGYTISALTTRECQEDSSWSNTNPTCDINDCGVLGNPSGGTVDSSAGTTYGSVATFTCDLGYTMTGTATSTCQADESWDNLDPGCHINGNGNKIFQTGAICGIVIGSIIGLAVLL